MRFSVHALRPSEAQAHFLGKFSPSAKPCNLPADGPENRFPHSKGMKIISKKTVYKGKYLKVIKKEFLTKTGKKKFWECVKRKNAVVIFSLTKKKEVILERIYRPAVDSFVIELPAGLLDKKGETPREAAKRELLEETGYLAKKLILVLKRPLDPAVLSNELFCFFAPNVELKGKAKTEDTEEIEVLKVPLKKLVSFLLNPPQNTKVDIKILSFLPILKNKKLI